MSPEMSRPALEEHRVGRIALGVLLAFLCFTIVVWNLPESETRRTLVPQVEPLVQTLGLWQGWAMFSPNPAEQAARVRAEVTFADGGVVEWRPPRPGPVTGVGRDERWRNWASKMRLEENHHLWHPAARFISKQVAEPGREIAQVSLFRMWTGTREPGMAAVQRQEWREHEFFIWEPASGRTETPGFDPERDADRPPPPVIARTPPTTSDPEPDRVTGS